MPNKTPKDNIEEMALKVLNRFIEAWSITSDYCFINYNNLEKLGYNKNELKPIIRLLKDKDLLVYEKGLWTEDGEMFGSGWSISDIEKANAYKEELEDRVLPTYTKDQVQAECEKLRKDYPKNASYEQEIGVGAYNQALDEVIDLFKKEQRDE